MEMIIILAIAIVVMEFGVEAIKKVFETMPVWEKIKGVCIPIINILAMATLILGTNATIFAGLGISCDAFVDYLFTILICSLGTSTWHEFKKKVKEVSTNKDGE